MKSILSIGLCLTLAVIVALGVAAVPAGSAGSAFADQPTAPLSANSTKCPFCGFDGRWTGQSTYVNSTRYMVYQCINGHQWLVQQ